MGKTLMLRKIEGQKEKGATEDEMVDVITDSMDMSLSQLREIVKHREAWHTALHGHKESDTTLQLNNSRAELWALSCVHSPPRRMQVFNSRQQRNEVTNMKCVVCAAAQRKALSYIT